MNVLGGMQDWDLRVTHLIDYAAREHGRREIITRWADGTIERSDWAGVAADARRLSQAFVKMGCKPGDRIATIAMNHHRHLATWYGAIGFGGVIHTVNVRLFDEDLIYIINHAEDRMVMVDLTFVPLLEKLADKLPLIERYVILTDRAHLPQTTLKNAVAYEDWIGEVGGNFKWVEVDENDAAAAETLKRVHLELGGKAPGLRPGVPLLGSRDRTKEVAQVAADDEYPTVGQGREREARLPGPRPKPRLASACSPMPGKPLPGANALTATITPIPISSPRKTPPSGTARTQPAVADSHSPAI